MSGIEAAISTSGVRQVACACAAPKASGNSGVFGTPTLFTNWSTMRSIVDPLVNSFIRKNPRAPREQRMDLTGEILIDAPRERVWRALNDPQVLVHSIPGCEEVQQRSPTETHVRVLIKLGPVRARFVGKILMSEVRPGAGCVLDFEGSGGAAGFAKGRSTVTLDTEAQGTRLRYTAQASVGGKLGQIGGRMIDASARQTADQFFVAFGQQLGVPQPPAATAPAAAVEVGSSTLATASRRVDAPAPASEMLRVLWFLLGAAATGFGVWIASAVTR
jgi:carbon monoxide dehydrogenase subunit G